MAENKPELQRGLEARHIELIALGGTIGVGLFMGAATISSSLAPAPPRISDRFGAAPAGKYNGNPTLRSLPAKRFGP